MQTVDNIRNDLLNMQDTAYRDFHSRLIPSVSKEVIIGVRTPALRKYAKQMSNKGLDQNFMLELPHKYYEENNLHAILIQEICDFDRCIYETQRFLPYIDNWATCDMLRPKCFKNNTDCLYPYIVEWISCDMTYTVRFAIGMLNSYYLNDKFDIEHIKLVSKIDSDEYYVKMMVAWYFATALTKQYENAIKVIENKVLDKWIHNKTIQKAVESYRISIEKKNYLRTNKI